MPSFTPAKTLPAKTQDVARSQTETPAHTQPADRSPISVDRRDRTRVARNRASPLATTEAIRQVLPAVTTQFAMPTPPLYLIVFTHQ